MTASPILLSVRTFARYLGAIPIRYWLLASSGWLTLGMTQLTAGSLPRVLSVFVFLLLCPGLALAGLTPAQGLLRWVLAVGLSMSAGLLVTTAMTVAQNGSFTVRIVILAAITTIAVLASRPDREVPGPGESSRCATDDEMALPEQAQRAAMKGRYS